MHSSLVARRDPKWFPLVLNFLRDGFVPLPPTLRERRELRQEALFYCLQVGGVGCASTVELHCIIRALRCGPCRPVWSRCHFRSLHAPIPCSATQPLVEQIEAADPDAAGRWSEQAPSAEAQAKQAADRLLSQLEEHTNALCEDLPGAIAEKLAEVLDAPTEALSGELARISRRLTALRHAVNGGAEDDDSDNGMM